MTDTFTDISGSRLQVMVRFPDQNQNWVESPIPTSFLSAQAQQLLMTPLSDQFQTFWAVTKDSSGQTQRDRAMALAQSGVASAVQSNTGQTAYNVVVNFPTSGRLFASATGNLVLHYSLPGEVITFKTTTSSIFGSYADPAFKVTFDATLEIASPIPSMPCSFSPGAAMIIENADIRGDNFIGQAAEVIGNVLNFFQDQPPIFQAAEGAIDAVNPVSIGSLGDTFAQLANACVQAQPAGFVQFAVSVDQSAAQLVFRLIHPLDPAPQFQDQTFPSLFHPLLGVSQLQIKAGDPLGVVGSYFTPPNTVSLVLQWNDTTSGRIVKSELQYGPPGGPPVTITIQRQPYDSANSYQFSSLTPNQTYQFRVRDWDATTATPWSAPKIVQTLGSSADQVLVWLDNGFANPLATVTVQPDGAFSTTVTIPSTTSTGPHLLNAQLMGGDAAQPVQIQVLAPGASYQPTIEMIDPTTSRTTSGGEESLPFTVIGYGFAAGPVSFTIDSPGGTSVGQATAGADGKIPSTTFTMPNGVIGSHQLVATQGSAQATWSVFSQVLPR
jgi:hypothetical protein